MDKGKAVRAGFGLVCALLASGCCRPAFAGEADVEAAARGVVEAARAAAANAVPRALAEGTAAGPGGVDSEDLGAWSRAVVDGALERVGAAADAAVAGADTAPAPLAAERFAARTGRGLAAARGAGPEVAVFLSLSVPAASWRQWSRQADRTGAAVVLRGVAPEGFRATAGRLAERMEADGAGAVIDPRLFRLFGIASVPAVVVVPGGVPPCLSRGCAWDPAPPHDRIAGNIGLDAALEAVAHEGGAGRETARRHLAALRGEAR